MGAKFELISPVHGERIAVRSYADWETIDQSLRRADGAFGTWKRSSLNSRAAVCRAVVRYFAEHVEELAMELTMQMGRPIRYSPLEIERGFTERAEYMIAAAEEALADVLIAGKPGYRRFIRREPLGTVLAIAPWNYPYLTSVNSIIPAIMAGNPVILKQARQTALCAERYAEAFAEAGTPDGVFQFLQLDYESVAKIIQEPSIAHVSFTGSVAGGYAIQKAVGKRFISAGLELGGKDPAYVCEDANLSDAVENLVEGAFFNSGQSCCAVERIYARAEIFDDFVAGFVDQTKKLVLGDPTRPETTLGPMISLDSARRAARQVEQAVSGGAEVLVGNPDFPKMDFPYFPPHVLVNVTHKMGIMREESFAPVIGIMPVTSDSEAIELMNDSPYGLSASIWTRNPDRAVTIGDQVNTGVWFMNRCDVLDPALPWTGVKDSGKGCTLSSLGYHYLTRPKSFHLRLPP